MARSIAWKDADDATITTMVLGGTVRAPSGAALYVGTFANRYLPALLTFLTEVTRLRPKFLKTKDLQPNEAEES
jgi:hypothetical protein